VLHGDPAPSEERGTAPIFGPCLLWPNYRPSQLLLSNCRITVRASMVRVWLTTSVSIRVRVGMPTFPYCIHSIYHY